MAGVPPLRRLAVTLELLQVEYPGQHLTGFIVGLKNAGLRLRREMEVGPGGREVPIEDPDGNPMELFEPAR